MCICPDGMDADVCAVASNTTGVGSGIGPNGTCNPSSMRQPKSASGPTGAFTKPLSCAKVSSNGNVPIRSDGTTLNQLIAADPVLAALTATLSNQNWLPSSVTINNNPEPEKNAAINPAIVNPAAGTLTLNTGDIKNAIDYRGAAANQIVFGEFEHIYYTRGIFSTVAGPQNISATINGTTYTWQIYTRDASGKAVYNNAGLSGAEHMLSHDDAVANYGIDQANFLAQALQDSGVAAAAATQIADANSKTTIAVTADNKAVITSFDPNTQCATATAASSRRAQSDSEVITGDVTFMDVWY